MFSKIIKDRVACLCVIIFVLINLLCFLGAPFWATYIAKTDYSEQHNGENVIKNDKVYPVLNDRGMPIGPGFWHGQWGNYPGRFLLGADQQGRDVAVRLLYGGANSLIIGFVAAIFIIIIGIIIAIPAGYFEGTWDLVFNIVMDTIWSFPAILLAVAIGTVLIQRGEIFFLQLGSKIIPVIVIAIVMVPYFAKPLRGETKAIKTREFITAAKIQGYGSIRIMFTEILPNLVKTIIAFAPLLVSNAILIEVAISFVGAGLQPPESSWGNLLYEGCNRLITAPYLTVIPGIFIIATNLCLNIFADVLQSSLKK